MYQHDTHKYLSFRRLEMRDLPGVLEMENSSYEFPWTELIFIDCLKSTYACQAVELYNELVAYSIVSVILDEAHLLNICVSDKWRRHGFAEFILIDMFETLKERKIKNLFLEVRPSNRVALALYLRLGFESVGIRKRYYPAKEGREDAIIMVKSLLDGDNALSGLSR